MRVAGTPVIIKEGEDEDGPNSGDSAKAAIGRSNTTTFDLGKEIGDPYVGWTKWALVTWKRLANSCS